MGNLPYDCPHCGVKMSNFTTWMTQPETSANASVFATCGVCKKGIVFHVKGTPNYIQSLDRVDMRDYLSSRLITEITTSPPERVRDNLQALPEDVRDAFDEAEECFGIKAWKAAAVMYRRAVEMAVTDIDDTLRGSLEQKIEAIRRNNAIPGGLVELMHMARFIGNDGAHKEKPTEEEITRGRDFTRLLLTYLYELPAGVSEAKARRIESGRKA